MTKQDKSDNLVITKALTNDFQLKKHAPICKLPAILNDDTTSDHISILTIVCLSNCQNSATYCSRTAPAHLIDNFYSYQTIAEFEKLSKALMIL